MLRVNLFIAGGWCKPSGCAINVDSANRAKLGVGGIHTGRITVVALEVLVTHSSRGHHLVPLEVCISISGAVASGRVCYQWGYQV